MPFPFPLGAFVGYPENGTTEATAFISLMGGAPSILNVYIDGTQTPAQWPSNNSYFVGEWASVAPWNTESGGKRTVAPMIGMPMGTTANTQAENLAYLKALPTGQYDSAITGMVAAWAAQGYTTQYWRPGVEMNLSSTPGFDSYIPGNAGVWVTAFQHIYGVLHAAFKTYGVTGYVVWNPGCCNDTAAGNATQTLYPGAAFCDIIAGDFYDNLNLFGGNPPQATVEASPYMLTQYYTYPACEGLQPASPPTVTDGSGGVCLSVLQLGQFAIAQKKPFGMCEVGGGTGPSDNPTFVEWLRATLNQLVAEGATIAFVCPWDDAGGGAYCFTGGQQPNAAVAWASNFGVNAPPATSTVTPPPTPVVTIPTASPSGTAIKAGGTLVDSSGNTWEIQPNTQIAFKPPGATTYTTVSSSWEVVELWWGAPAGASLQLYQLNSSGQWYQQPLANANGNPITGTPPGYTHPPSTAGSDLTAGESGTLWDSAGNAWTLPASAVPEVNGEALAGVEGVEELVWTGVVMEALMWVTIGPTGTVAPAAPPAGHTLP